MTIESLMLQAAEYLRRGHIEIAWSVLHFAQYDMQYLLANKKLLTL